MLLQNDIALIRLQYPFESSDYIQKIELGEKIPAAGDPVTCAGMFSHSLNSCLRKVSPHGHAILLRVLSLSLSADNVSCSGWGVMESGSVSYYLRQITYDAVSQADCILRWK